MRMWIHRDALKHITADWMFLLKVSAEIDIVMFLMFALIILYSIEAISPLY